MRPVTSAHDWMVAANCRDVDPETFFPERKNGEATRRAKAICRACTVRVECLDMALVERIDDGIYGDTTPAERKRIRERRRRMAEHRDRPYFGDPSDVNVEGGDPERGYRFLSFPYSVPWRATVHTFSAMVTWWPATFGLGIRCVERTRSAMSPVRLQRMGWFLAVVLTAGGGSVLQWNTGRFLGVALGFPCYVAASLLFDGALRWARRQEERVP